MSDDYYNDDLSGHDPDLLEAEADLLLGEDFDDGSDINDDLDIPHKKPHVAGEDELDDLDGYEDDLDSFDFHDDLGADELADEDI
jgi:hypothetical protein